MKEKYIKFILYLIIVILLNLVCKNHFFKIDMTKTKMYSLSKKSISIVSRLDEPMTIKCFFTKNLPPPYNTIKQYLKDLLKEYSEYSNKNFNFEFINPNNKNFIKLANEYGINPVQVQVIQKDELKYKSVYMGIVLIHGDCIEKIPVINTTNRLEYLLTTSMEKLINKVSYLLNLHGYINVNFYLSKNLFKIAPYIGIKNINNLPSKIKEVINELNKTYYNKLKYNYIDLKVSDKNIDELNKIGIQILKWPELNKVNIKKGKGGIGLILKYKNEHIPIVMLRVMNLPLVGTQYILTQPDELKEILETSIQSLLHINQSIGYLTSQDTLSLYSNPFNGVSSANNFRKLLSQCYDIKEVDLNKGIPPNLNTLIIAGPKKKFTDYDLFEIDQALMRGTNLAIFLDTYKEIPGRQGMLIENKTGLEKLLLHYGIEIKPSIVMDKNCYKQTISRKEGGGERPIYFAPIIKSKNINHKLKYLENINALIMLKNSPIYVKNKKLKTELLFTSSDKSWENKNNMTLNPIYIYPPKEKDMKKFPLSYIIEGNFTSYFIDKNIPEKKSKKDVKKLNTKDNETTPVKAIGTKINRGYGKIFIIGSSDILTDSIIDSQGDTPNSIFIMNIIDVLNDKIERAILRSKIELFNPLQDISNFEKTYIKLFNIIILPIFIIIFGFIMRLFRINKKKKIRMMFKEI